MASVLVCTSHQLIYIVENHFNIVVSTNMDYYEYEYY